MSHYLHIAIEVLRWATCAAMLAVSLGAAAMGVLLCVAPRGHWFSDRIFGILLGLMSLTLFNNLMAYWGISIRNPKLYFLPIYYSLSLGPLIFFLAKSKLYPQLRLHRSDLKHFILPFVQAAVFWWVGLHDTAYKMGVKNAFFSPIYGGFEDWVYTLTTGMYFYFGYRFVKFEMSTARQRGVSRRQIMVIGWLKRMIKILFILFAVHASCLVSDWINYRLFDVNLNNKALFSAFTELSFGAMVGWLTLNAWFAWRRRL